MIVCSPVSSAAGAGASPPAGAVWASAVGPQISNAHIVVGLDAANAELTAALSARFLKIRTRPPPSQRWPAIRRASRRNGWVPSGYVAGADVLQIRAGADTIACAMRVSCAT
jgi:hypothetical protein